MNKTVAVVIAAIIIIAGAWFIFAGKNDNVNNGSSANSSNQNQSQNQSATTPVNTNSVSIADMSFKPAEISVKKGTKVTWTNNDGIAHTVTETDGKTGPSSPEMAPGSSYSFTYDEAGTFSYHCSIHPDMTGTVTVTQ